MPFERPRVGTVDYTRATAVVLVDTNGEYAGADPAMAVGDLSSVVINFMGTGDQAVIPAVSGKAIRVHRMRIYTSAATSMSAKSGASTILETVQFPGAGNFILDFSPRAYWTTAVGQAFVLNSSAAVTVTGRVEYVAI